MGVPYSCIDCCCHGLDIHSSRETVEDDRGFLRSTVMTSTATGDGCVASVASGSTVFTVFTVFTGFAGLTGLTGLTGLSWQTPDPTRTRYADERCEAHIRWMDRDGNDGGEAESRGEW